MTEVATKAKREPTAIETVTMDDGRIVDFAGKKRLQKESIKTTDGKLQVRLDFRNGETRLFTIPDGLLADFALHGAEQKLGDEIAGLDAIDDAVLAVDELMERLDKGEWGIKRDSSGLAGTSILLKALVELYKKDSETVAETTARMKAFLSDKSQAQKLALRGNPKVKPIVDRLEGERAQGTKVDSGALLAGLEG